MATVAETGVDTARTRAARWGMTVVSRKRHIAKALSWRAVGTLDTMFVSWLVTGDALVGLSIGLFELVSKTALYYFHERAWYRMSDFGLDKESTGKENQTK